MWINIFMINLKNMELIILYHHSIHNTTDILINQITGHRIRIPNYERDNLTMSFWLFCGFIQQQ